MGDATGAQPLESGLPSFSALLQLLSQMASSWQTTTGAHQPAQQAASCCQASCNKRARDKPGQNTCPPLPTCTPRFGHNS